MDLSSVIKIDVSQTLFVCQVLYATAVTITKTSIIASYLRIFPTAVFGYLMAITTAVIVALWICSVFITIFQCHPVQEAWDITLQKKNCLDILKFFYFAASVNITTDLVLCISPLPLISKLNLPANERVMLCTLFGLGLL